MGEEKTLIRPFYKDWGATPGLKKGFIKEEEMLGLGYPEEVQMCNGKSYLVESTPMAVKHIYEDGTEKILQSPFRRCVPVTMQPTEEYFQKEQQIQALNRQMQALQMQPKLYINTGVPESMTGMIYTNPKNMEEELLTNFNIKPIKILEVLEGESMVEKNVVFEIDFAGTVTNLTVPSEKLDMIADIVKKEVLGAIVYCNIYAANTKLVEVIRQSLAKGVAIQKKQKKSGWSLYEKMPIFFHDAHEPLPGEPLIETGKAVLTDSSLKGQAGLIFEEILKIAPAKVIAPMIATAVLAPLHRLFAEANAAFVPQFALFINGRSGSFKTAVAKVLFNIFNTNQVVIPASFKDTATSLEKRLQEYAHAPVLIDDFYATGLSRDRASMQKSLEMVIRYVGDGIGKNRSNGILQDVKGIPPTGMVIITGEDTAGQLSTLLRCLIINVDRDTFDANILTEFQNSPLMWSTFFAAFLQFLERNYASIVEYLRKEGFETRKSVEQLFRDRRPADQLAQCILAFRILNKFLRLISPETALMDALCEQCIAGCQEAVVASQNYAEQNSAEEKYCFYLVDAIFSNQIALAENKERYEKEITIFDGFWTDEFIFCRSESVYTKIRKNLKNQGKDLTLDELNAKRALDKAGIIVTQVECKGTANEKKNLEIKVSINGKRVRMLKIIRSALDTYLEKH